MEEEDMDMTENGEAVEDQSTENGGADEVGELVEDQSRENGEVGEIVEDQSRENDGEIVEDQSRENGEVGAIVEDQSIENGGAHEVVISIEDLATSMEESMENQPKQLKTTAGDGQCSIFRIPRNLEAINPQAPYQPQIVSIGPYHHGKPELSMMEEHKCRFMKALLARSQQGNGPRLRDYLTAMAELEHDARACYSEEITTMKSEQFVRMLLLDGCFLVELFRSFEGDREDPIFSMPWLITFVARDLLRLENQLPLFVLQRLFHLSFPLPSVKAGPEPPFPLLAIKFFSWALIRRPDVAIKWSTREERRHLLDLFRATFISPELEKRGNDQECKRSTLRHCVTELVRSGIKFRPVNKANTFLDIKFKKKGVLMIPRLKIDDFARSFLQNCIAFEQSHLHSGFFFTSFAFFMGRLTDAEKDVSLLVDAKVITNGIGRDEEVANFFNKLGRDVVFDLKNCYLGKEFEEVNRYFANFCNVACAQFKIKCFSSKIISGVTALILLIIITKLGLR